MYCTVPYTLSEKKWHAVSSNDKIVSFYEPRSTHRQSPPPPPATVPADVERHGGWRGSSSTTIDNNRGGFGHWGYDHHRIEAGGHLHARQRGDRCRRGQMRRQRLRLPCYKKVHLSKMDSLYAGILKIYTDIFKMDKKVHLGKMDCFVLFSKVGPFVTSISY